jgi:arginine decarboxylase
MFQSAFDVCDYKGSYTYCYCTKSSHFSFVLREALRNDIHVETSSAFDIPLIRKLHKEGRLEKDRFIVCNGFKRPEYLSQINDLMEDGFTKVIPVLDNKREFEFYDKNFKHPFNIGLRIATEEMPNFDFYTSRLGINPSEIESFYSERVANHEFAKLKMLHFFINTGIKDHVYYWNELHKCLKLYVALKKICPELDTLNIGGGFPFKTHLGFDYDYQDFVNKIIFYIKDICAQEEIEEPNIFTEFGSFTVAESGAIFYEVLDAKHQNDRETWYMINNSFMTTLPDCWGIDQRFIMLPLNQWYSNYKRVFLGGLTCDSLDFYNSEVHNNKLFLPELEDDKPLYVGFFNIGAYQESIAGFGGTKHCLIPSPKHVIIDQDENGKISTHVFAEEQNAESMLKILGYE